MTEKMTGRTLPLLIYFLIGIPRISRHILNIHQLKYAHWLLLLNLGTLVQAFVVIAFLLGLPLGPSARDGKFHGSHPSCAPESSHHSGHCRWVAYSLAWWQLFRYATHLSGEQDYIFGRRPFSLGYYPGTLSGGMISL